MTDYEFKALRPGEAERVCEECGRAYAPNSRTQRRCPACKAEAESGRGLRSRRRAKRKEEKMKVERKVDANTIGLNAALFRELERMEACETTEEWEAEGARADRVCSLASAIIQNGKLMLRAAEASYGTAEAVEVPRALLGRGDGE